tara:strand:+ start:1589 stop:2575 length:987 start_codon:yes stop_codon:yes gene_type:complete
MAIKRWMLPDGMEETLPPSSWQLETLRRSLLDHYRELGYELILPPLVEHLDSLLTGSGSDLEQQTFKFADAEGGRMLGIRADMTPQAARIAARRYSDSEIVRLCYLGTVLRTTPETPGGPRSPRQVGCELFGVASLDADLEALKLMLKTLSLAGVEQVHLDLGHVEIYRAVVASLGLSVDDEAQLFDIVQRKSQPDLLEFGRTAGLELAASRLSALMNLHGNTGVLKAARQALGQQDPRIDAALDQLEQVCQTLGELHPEIPLHLDLAELRGLRYHTGLVFSAYVPGHGREIARGGRYDGVGREFGRALPATGFSADMNELLRLGADA